MGIHDVRLKYVQPQDKNIKVAITVVGVFYGMSALRG